MEWLSLFLRGGLGHGRTRHGKRRKLKPLRADYAPLRRQRMQHLIGSSDR
jgi:hypothetical protein